MKGRIAALALVALIVAGCDEAPTTSSADDPMARPAPSTPANPALCYEGYTTLKGKGYRTVAVMDADGTHQTNLYGTTLPIGTYLDDESWSPGGTSISFVENNGSTTAPVGAIKAIDLSVNSSGAAIGSNVRTIYDLPAGYGTSGGVQWSSTSAMNKIAFATWNPNTTDRTLWVVPATGGAPIRVWGSDATYIKEDGSVLGHRQTLSNATWSPNDERLAAVRLDSAGAPTNPYAVATIMIFNTTDNGNTWTYTDSIKIAGSTSTPVANLEWSRGANGIDKLAYGNLNYNANKGQIFYVDPVTNAVPTTQGVLGRCPSWSPDNMTLIYNNRSSGDYLSKITSFSTNVSNVVVNPSYGAPPTIRWKR
jgi:hypothetical protein